MGPYIALIHKDDDSDFGVSFPDLPGCVTAGRTLDEARTMAVEALALHLAGMADDGEAIPEPSTLDAVMRDADNRDGVVVLIDAPAAAARVVRINITVPETDLRAIDSKAEAVGMTRSAFMVRASLERGNDQSAGRQSKIMRIATTGEFRFAGSGTPIPAKKMRTSTK